MITTSKQISALPRGDLQAAIKAPEGVRVDSFWDEVRVGCVIRAGKFTSTNDTGEVFVPLNGNTGPGQFFNAEIAAAQNLLQQLKLLP